MERQQEQKRSGRWSEAKQKKKIQSSHTRYLWVKMYILLRTFQGPQFTNGIAFQRGTNGKVARHTVRRRGAVFTSGTEGPRWSVAI